MEGRKKIYRSEGQLLDLKTWLSSLVVKSKWVVEAVLIDYKE